MRGFRQIGVSTLLGILASVLPFEASALTRFEQEKMSAFLGHREYKVNLLELEKKGLLKAQLAEKPWSDTYWPDSQGSLNNAYAASTLPGSFAARKSTVLSRLGNLSSDQLDELSPSEKYDILLGDFGFSFSKGVEKMLEEMARRGMVDGWTGVCHGWSPASLQEKRPLHSVNVRLAEDKYMVLRPSDIKGLLTFGWGKSKAQEKAIVHGKQCWTNLELDRRGRAVRNINPHANQRQYNCGEQDLSAEFFHIALVNMIGFEKRGFIGDMQLAKSVWNHPVYAYEIRLFNEKTKTWAKTVREGAVAVEAGGPLPKALQTNRLGADTKYFVGVDAIYDYAVESGPTSSLVDDPLADYQTSKVSRYWLKLDGNYNVIGAEWEVSSAGESMRDRTAEASLMSSITDPWERRYGRQTRSPVGALGRYENDSRPDIMWTPTATLHPFTAVEWNNPPNFDITKVGIPSQVKKMALESAKNIRYDGVPNPQIMYSISRELLRLSRLPQTVVLDLTRPELGYKFPSSVRDLSNEIETDEFPAVPPPGEFDPLQRDRPTFEDEGAMDGDSESPRIDS